MKSVIYSSWPSKRITATRFFLLGLAFGLLLEGCALTPDTPKIEDIFKAIKPDTIISADTGMPLAFETLIAYLSHARVIYVGEQHTNPAHHKIQLKVIKTLYASDPDLVVGMEMFDHTYQPVLDQWTAGQLDQKAFLEKVHWYANWRFDFELYQEILLFIKEKKIKLVGLNLPNDIPPRVRIGGIDNLSDADKKHLPEKIDLSHADHRAYAREVFDRHHASIKGNFEYFYMAQCVWEDTMAEAISRNLKGAKMVVLAGNGHIIRKFGIPDRAYLRTKVSFQTIYTAAVGSSLKLSFGDYIWVTAQ